MQVYLHVKYAGEFCVFHAKKSRIIFRASFSPVQDIYWTFRPRGCLYIPFLIFDILKKVAIGFILF